MGCSRARGIVALGLRERMRGWDSGLMRRARAFVYLLEYSAGIECTIQPFFLHDKDHAAGYHWL